MVTVEADQVRVEFRLTDGQLDCPTAWRAWGRLAAAAAGPMLGVSGHACVVAGHGNAAARGRRRGDRRGVDCAGGLSWPPADRGLAGCVGGHVRGWLRRWGTRLHAARVHFTVAARLAGVDQAVPKAMGSPWRDELAASGAATAVTARFGTAGVIGPVRAWQVAAASSGSRLLSPGCGNTSCPRRTARWVLDCLGVIAQQHLSGDPSDEETEVSTVVNAFDEDAVKAGNGRSRSRCSGTN